MAKFKSLKVTRWTRLREFFRGVLLYNTVYWRRASDGVDRNASRVGPEERAKHRPQVDPELLRPRARPLAVETPEPESRKEPPAASKLRNPPPPSPPRLAMPSMGDELFGQHLPDAGDGRREDGRSQRRRRVVRRRELRDKAVDPARVLRARGDAKPKRPLPGWLRWLIGWHH